MLTVIFLMSIFSVLLTVLAIFVLPHYFDGWAKTIWQVVILFIQISFVFFIYGFF